MSTHTQKKVISEEQNLKLKENDTRPQFQVGFRFSTMKECIRQGSETIEKQNLQERERGKRRLIAGITHMIMEPEV